jgi:FMN phosphatase YigB (HAD superfamily)
MVHALDEIRRVLLPDGTLIDIRPFADGWQVEIASASGVKEIGRVNHLPAQVDPDIASNEAMKEVESRGWFEREQEELFPFLYSWDTPSEMEKFITEDWEDSVELSDEVKKAARAAWAIGDADSHVRVRVKILITKWRVRGASRR